MPLRRTLLRALAPSLLVAGCTINITNPVVSAVAPTSLNVQDGAVQMGPAQEPLIDEPPLTVATRPSFAPLLPSALPTPVPTPTASPEPTPEPTATPSPTPTPTATPGPQVSMEPVTIKAVSGKMQPQGFAGPFRLESGDRRVSIKFAPEGMDLGVKMRTRVEAYLVPLTPDFQKKIDYLLEHGDYSIYPFETLDGLPQLVKASYCMDVCDYGNIINVKSPGDFYIYFKESSGETTITFE